MQKTIVIAEAGVNHNGDLNIAKRLIKEAAKAGADFVKFQSFKANLLASKSAKLAYYQSKNIKEDNQLSMLKKLELDKKAHLELIKECQRCNISFLSTAFDSENLELLNELKLELFKISSTDLTNLPYLKEVARLDKKILLSTGMANLAEVEFAIDILCKNGTKRKNITLLHCTSEYPAPVAEVNLRAMLTLKEAFKLKVGYSDHTKGIHISLAAAALGAVVIEKHFTLDKNMQGPDHKASLEPDELKALCDGVKDINLALGNGIKKASKSERKNLKVARKSLVALKDIKKGEFFSKENLGTKRPGNGISACKYDEYLGKMALKNYKKDELI